MPKTKAEPAPEPKPSLKNRHQRPSDPGKADGQAQIKQGASGSSSQGKAARIPKALPKQAGASECKDANNKFDTTESRAKKQRTTKPTQTFKARIIWPHGSTSWSRMNRNANRRQPAFCRTLLRSKIRLKKPKEAQGTGAKAGSDELTKTLTAAAAMPKERLNHLVT